MEIIKPTSFSEGKHPFHDQQTDSPSKTKPARINSDRPAGFTRRMIAYMIDGFIILNLFLFFTFSGLMGIRFSGVGRSPFDSAFTLISLIAFFFIYTGYFTYFHASDGQTPAKMIMRIRVVRGDGQPLSHLHAFIRTFGFFLSHLFFGFGFLLSIIERKKRALHDLLANTYVILAP